MASSVLPPGARKVHQQGSTFYVVGDERQWLRDAYHSFLHLPWSAAFGMIAIAFFVFNIGFAFVYLEVGGIAGADGSFTDALSFSVQTMATIGYGVMHPESNPANGAMIIESMFGIIFTALATGLVFAKFSRPTTRVRYSSTLVIANFDGQRTLMFRIGNRRSNVIVEAQLHVVALLTTLTAEGETFYKAHDLKLVRERQVGMTRGWTVMHVIDPTSPLYGLDDDGMQKAELEIHIALTGIDSITMQSVHSMHSYAAEDVRSNYRFEDTLKPLADGTFLVDLRNFDATVPDATPRDSVRA
jgi:inward rectifier potassium channel